MTEQETLTSGMVGREVRLEFSDDWRGLTKTAVFMAGTVIRDVVGVTDTAVIPAEVLAEPLQQLYVGVYGVSDDGRVTPTIRAAGPMIEPGMDPSGDEGTAPDLPVWAQIQQEIEQLQELGVDGEDGGYYIPAVSQTDDNTARISFVPSKEGMAAVAGQDIALPQGLQGPAGAAGEKGRDGGYYMPVVTQPKDTLLQFNFTPSNETVPPIPPVAFFLPVAEAPAGLSDSQATALYAVISRIGAWTEEDPETVQQLLSEFRTAFAITGEESHTHHYTAAVTTEASCTAAGVKTYTCACGETYTESIPATGHRYMNGACILCGAAAPDDTPDVTLSGISASYGGGSVAAGTALTDLTDIVVTAHYSDGSTETVTGYTLSGTIAEGDNTITASYGGMSATITVTGVAESGGDGGNDDEITGEFGLVIPQGHKGCVTLDITPADADSMEITLALPAVKTGAIVCNGEKWIGIYTDYPEAAWGNKPSVTYASIAGQGKTTISYSSISTLNQTTQPIGLTYAPNSTYTLGYTLYEMVFYKDGTPVCDLKPTTVLGNLYDSVSAKTYTFTVTEGLSFA